MSRLNKLLTGHQITDELINRTSSASLPLGHDTILKTGVVVRTAAVGGGTLLALTTDYTLGSEDTRLTTEAGETVYTKLAIVNGAYQSTDLYVTYKTVGDYGSVESVVDIVYPVGSFYTQYPDADSNDDAIEFPVSMRPATLFGGTWVEQWASESVYFRTRGTLSDSGRTSGKQGDALQGHIHKIPPVGLYGNSSGASSSVYYNGSYTNDSGPPSTDGTYGTPRTSSETRTVNRRIKVWKRTA